MVTVWRRMKSAGVAVLAMLACFDGASLAGESGLASPRVEAKNPELKQYQLQISDEPLKPLVPLKPRTAGDQARIDAKAYFMAGQLKEARGDFQGAYQEYRKAVALDANSLAIYQALLPLAFNLGKTDEAVKYALKAVELDPNDFRLLRRLGVHMANRQKLGEAIKLLEKALQSKTLNQPSAVYVMMKRDLGILYSRTGQKNKAADTFEVVLDALINPDKFKLNFRMRAALIVDPSRMFGTTYELIGQAFLDAQRLPLAVKAFEQAAKARRGKPGRVSYNLARVYLQTKQLEKALDQLHVYLDAQLQSKGRAAYQLLADILKEMDKSDELIGRLEALIQKDKHNSILQYFLAEQYLANNRLRKAEKLYMAALQNSGGSEGYVGLAVVYRRQSRPTELLDALTRAVKGGGDFGLLETEMKAIGEDENLLDSLIAVGRKLAEGDEPKLDFAGSFILAKLAARAAKTKAAVEFYRFALKTVPNQRAALIYEELGIHLVSVKQFAEAVQVFQDAINDPVLEAVNHHFLYRLSTAYEFNGNTKQALTAVQAARKLRPKSARLHFQEGWVHYHSRQWDQAIRIFEQVISKYPSDKAIVRRCLFTLSNLYVQQGKMREGEEILEKILAQEPDNPSVNNDLGYLYADQGKNLEQAEQMIRKAVKVEPENAAYLDSLGWVLFKLGKFAEAIPHLEKAVKLPSGSDATIWDHLGDCYDSLQKSNKAQEAWQKAWAAAKKQSRPDEKQIERIEGKLKNKKQDIGKPSPERDDVP